MACEAAAGSPARIASAIARCPARDERGRSGWDSDSRRVSRTRPAISPIRLASSGEWAAAVTAAVEALVALDAAPARLDVGGHQAEGLVDAGQVVRRTPFGGQRGELGLERVAGVDDLGQPVGVRADRLDHASGPGRAHDGAVPVAHGHHADDLQRDQGLAQRGAADPEPRGELALGRDPVPGLQSVVLDPAADLLGDLLVERVRVSREGRPGESPDPRGDDVMGASVLTPGLLAYWLGH